MCLLANCTVVPKTVATCSVRENDHRRGSIEVTAITLDLGSRTPITFYFHPGVLIGEFLMAQAFPARPYSAHSAQLALDDAFFADGHR